MLKEYNDKLAGRLYNRAIEVVDMIDYMAQTSGESPELIKGVKTLAANRDIKLIIVRTHNPPVVIASNKHALIGLPADDFFTPHDITRSFRFSSETNLYHAISPIWLGNRLKNGQLTKATVGVVFNTAETRTQLQSQIINTSITLVLTMIFVLCMVYLLTNRYVFKPLEIINNSLIQNNSKKEFTPIPLLRDDEIGSVSNTLNRLFSDLYQSETSLREQKERYDLALQGTKVGLLDWDINTDTVHCSASVSEMIGLESTEFQTDITWLANHLHEDDKEYAQAALISHLKRNKAYDIECRVKHECGYYIWVRARGQAVRDDSGRATRMVGYFVDISKHRAHEHFMNSLYLLSANASMKLDAKLNKILKEALNYLNLSCGSIYKIENGICITKYIQSEAECAFKLNSKFNLKDTLCVQTIKTKDIVAIHNVGISKLRKNPAHKIYGVNSYISMPLYVHGKIYGTVSFFDKKIREEPFEERERSFVRLLSQWIGNEITREQYIDYLHDSEVQLEEAVSELTSINSELENFVYVASHDLQEPLRMITNFTGLLENNATNQLDNIAKEYLNIISNSAIQMRLLIKDLLDYARANKEDDKIENVDLNEVINHVCANLEKQIHESNTKLIFNKLPTIYGNKASMISLLQNLISNGIKFQHKDESPVIVIQAREISVGLELSVKDNGIGIHANYLSKIFEPFKRLHAKSEYQGTGIGLAVCKKITDRMDGTIRVESTEGVGSTFYITIPNQTIKAGKAA